MECYWSIESTLTVVLCLETTLFITAIVKLRVWQFIAKRWRTLPKNIDRFFRNLVGIYINNSKLLAISAEDLQPFPDLLYFRSFTNPLVSIDGDLFKHTSNLTYVALFDSQLQHVGYDLLTWLNDLMEVDVRATNPEAIAALKRNLSISCSPTTEIIPDNLKERIRELEQTVLRIKASFEGRIADIVQISLNSSKSEIVLRWV